MSRISGGLITASLVLVGATTFFNRSSSVVRKEYEDIDTVAEGIQKQLPASLATTTENRETNEIVNEVCRKLAKKNQSTCQTLLSSHYDEFVNSVRSGRNTPPSINVQKLLEADARQAL